MKRRTVLSTVAGMTTLSGCGSLRSSERLATVSIHSQDTIDEKHGVSVSAEVVNSTIMSSKTAKVAIHVENTSNKTKVVADRYPAFIPTVDDSSNPKLQLLPTSRGYISVSGTFPAVMAKVEQTLSSSTYVKSKRNCWVPKYSHAFEGRFVYRTLHPGEKFTNKYEVWGSKKSEEKTCIPNGKFGFSTEYFTRSTETNSPKKITDWSFSIAVRQPTER